MLSVRTWHITEEVVCCADSFVIADSWILNSLTFALWSWLAVRSAVRDNFVGTVLKDISFSITKHGGQWNALNTLFLLLIQRTLHGLGLEDELIFGVE